MENKNTEQKEFIYTYSAKEQAEVKLIRDKYTLPHKSEDKMARLRRLDKSVTTSARRFALVFGVIGTLILGFGMSLVMTDLSETLRLNSNAAFVLGIIIGVMGGVVASLAYPIYNVILKNKRKKIAPEIIRLSDELLK